MKNVESTSFLKMYVSQVLRKKWVYFYAMKDVSGKWGAGDQRTRLNRFAVVNIKLLCSGDC